MVGIAMQYNADGLLVPVIRNGTLHLEDTLHQNQAIILSLHKGELKENPAVGVGISDMLLDEDPLKWRSEIREQLEMDGQTVNDIKITRTTIDIDAHY